MLDTHTQLGEVGAETMRKMANYLDLLIILH
jgi:hypothetical protein